jgi:hypothetical protein
VRVERGNDLRAELLVRRGLPVGLVEERVELDRRDAESSADATRECGLAGA